MKSKWENEYKPITTGEKSLTESQVSKLLAVITDLNDLGLFKLALTAGIRRSDIVAIDTSSVNAGESSITFYEAKKKSNHTVYVPKSVINTLEMMMNINKKSKWLFPSSNPKRHISSKTAYNRFQCYLKKAELPQKPFHALRGTCAKLCQRKGWPVERTARLLNDTIQTVQGHYTTPSTEEMKETAEDKAIL